MQQKKWSNYAKLVTCAGIGFSVFWLTSHPRSKVRKYIRPRRYKKLSFLPSITYDAAAHTYHFHHWALLSVTYLSLLTSKKLRKSRLFHGLFLGSIVQGLFFQDRFQFRYPKTVENSL